MSDNNAIAMFKDAGMPVDPSKFAAKLSTFSGTSTKPILKLTKSGEWVYGVDSIEAAEDALIALNPFTLKHGYVIWNKDTFTKIDEKMVPVASDADCPYNKQIADEGGQYQLSIEGMFIDGDDQGVEFIYPTNSVGGVNMLSEFMNKLGAVMAEHPSRMVAICKLEAKSYNHKKFGKVYNPVFEIVRWTSMQSPNMEEHPQQEMELEGGGDNSPWNEEADDFAEPANPKPEGGKKPSRNAKTRTRNKR